uniref:CDP-diacylglycerol--glycerol-3-phosphate 3-phosphatidyltransferase n=1 Tax=Chromera velia CCMP2878 TaxID=1169474 RepID=A0A0G4HDC9_9ALVE|eukprot:Cvel_26456.t1-p1 / transcript=Cvel_26456.t1 / gene=Cvel_26456 / organism=Chromera_velia_CCMP2878 / gene_product=CDP-diacylglycerol--glycerol-3-phosphate, putative / transcript_product=CDP-diacylglycerol--glycerol-3-phosphate, putative / location=Cvel_scaffold3146:14512-18081(+) / protein_length=498 / sequence_SO=supercontig / SO=protein_coding / is_pseudo=false
MPRRRRSLFLLLPLCQMCLRTATGFLAGRSSVEGLFLGSPALTREGGRDRRNGRLRLTPQAASPSRPEGEQERDCQWGCSQADLSSREAAAQFRRPPPPPPSGVSKSSVGLPHDAADDDRFRFVVQTPRKGSKCMMGTVCPPMVGGADVGRGGRERGRRRRRWETRASGGPGWGWNGGGDAVRGGDISFSCLFATGKEEEERGEKDDEGTVERIQQADWVRAIPNVLTITRILVVPVLVSAFYGNSQPLSGVASGGELSSSCSSINDRVALSLNLYENFVSISQWTFGIFAAASLTDFLDGILARKLNITSQFGAFLDPVADKVMVCAVLVLLAERYQTPLVTVPAVLILCREIGISALREWMAQSGRSDIVKVAFSGKLKTATQMLALLLLLSSQPVMALAGLNAGIQTPSLQSFFCSGLFKLLGPWRGCASRTSLASPQMQEQLGSMASSLVTDQTAQTLELTFWAGTGFLWVSAALAVQSAVEYFRASWRDLQNE